MAAWDSADLFDDRLEARGEAAALEGVAPTEAFYPEWGPTADAVAAAGKALLAACDSVIELLESAA